MRDLFDNQLRWLVDATVPAQLRPDGPRLTPSEARIAFAFGLGALIVWLVIYPSLKLSARDMILGPFFWGSLSAVTTGLGHGFGLPEGVSRISLQIARVLWGIALLTTPIYLYWLF